MRLICPHCMSAVTVPDDAAGKEAVCPNCGKSFPTPARYAASVVPDAATPVAGPIEPVRTSPHPEPPLPPGASAAPPGYAPPGAVPPGYAPPGYVPPPPLAPSGFLPAGPASAEVPTAAGYTHATGFTISPKVVAWFPAIFLTLAFVLTFFPWVGTHLGGYLIYSQGPWRAVTGYPERNPELVRIAPESLVGWTDKVKSDWMLMVPFLLLLIVAMLLAVVDRVLPSFDPHKVPPLVKVWPLRHLIIAVLSSLALALVVIQSIQGFGLERAVRQVVRDDPALAKEREAAAGNTEKLLRVEYKEEQEMAKFNLGRTVWMHLAVVCIAIGALSAIGLILLERRGNKPPPKLLLHY